MSEARTRVTEIAIPYPDTGEPHLQIGVGACRLHLRPGDATTWVSGTYTDPTGELQARITREGATARISQNYEFTKLLGLFSGPPRFDLALGTAQPFSLRVESGASENVFDLGGVPLVRLVIKHGAGKNDINFSVSNPREMTLLEIGAGAGAMNLQNLANANFAEMRLDGGAAAYRLDFGGTLRRNAHVRISTGLSSVEITIPAATAAKVTSESLLGGLDVSDGWTKREGAFWTAPAVAGTTPVLDIHTNVALGSLQLRVGQGLPERAR